MHLQPRDSLNTGSEVGSIIGGVFGGLALLVSVVVCVLMIIWRHEDKKSRFKKLWPWRRGPRAGLREPSGECGLRAQRPDDLWAKMDVISFS